MSLHKLITTLFVQFKDEASGALEFAPGHDGKPDMSKPVGVRVHSPGAQEARALEAKITNENLKRKGKGVTAELLEQNNIERLKGRTIEYVNFPEANLPSNGQEIYTDPSWLHLRDQVQDALTDYAGFLQKV